MEEVVQDVFVTFWSKAASLDPGGNVKAYLYATLRNNVLHELRTAYTRAYYLQKLKMTAPLSEESDCLQSMYLKETEEQLHQIMATLPPQCREAFSLSRFEQLSYKEIAERMHLSINTVEKHVAKALRILRHRMGKFSDVSFIILFILSSRL